MTKTPKQFGKLKKLRLPYLVFAAEKDMKIFRSYFIGSSEIHYWRFSAWNHILIVHRESGKLHFEKNSDDFSFAIRIAASKKWAEHCKRLENKGIKPDLEKQIDIVPAKTV